MKALPHDLLPMKLTPLLRAGTQRRTPKGCRNGQGDCSGRSLRALGLRKPARLILFGIGPYASFACRLGGYD